MPKSISITWTEGISRRESQVLLAAVEQVIKWLYFHHPMSFYDPPLPIRVFGNWVIPAMMDGKDYWGTQWFIENSYDKELGRVIAMTFLELVKREPWQRAREHYDFAMIDSDMTELPAPVARGRPDSYCLGASYPGTAAVISVNHVRRITDRSLRDRALTRLVHHYLGHTLAVPDFARQENVIRRGLEMHCTNRCVMRHAATIEDLIDLTRDEADMDWPFCSDCTRGLHTVVAANSIVWS
jgi:hypothetical protein